LAYAAKDRDRWSAREYVDKGYSEVTPPETAGWAMEYKVDREPILQPAPHALRIGNVVGAEPSFEIPLFGCDDACAHYKQDR
jgi:hypothetical protein